MSHSDPASQLDEVRAAALTAGVVVIGAGQAGGRAVEALRAQGFAGAITLIGDEPEYPYERPSLSKEMLHVADQETIAWVQKPEFYVANQIDFRPGTRVVAINRGQRSVQLEGGDVINYGALIIATGARVRRLELPGASQQNSHYIRTLADSRALRERLVAGGRVVVIGAGFIGLEAAAAAVKRGCAVTVIEIGPQPLGRVVPAQIGAYYESLHASHGVEFLFNTGLARFHQLDETVVVETNAGDMIPAEMVIVGIGVIPNAELAAEAGLAVDRGIIVDEYGRTEDKFIFAAGDVARHLNPLFDRHILLESWQNAQNQAIAIAKNLASPAGAAPYAELPWFWSDQYDVNLQMFGLAEPEADFVIRGNPATKSWMLLQLKNNRMICAIGMNSARDLRPSRDLITMGAVVKPEELADVSVPMAEILRREKRERALVG
jgi:NADPH-dependent 2,4-dienoyl-CoA reductase/sulfur reductase-like enzyme